MNLQEKAVNHILTNPNSTVIDIMTAVPCGKSVAYAAMSAYEKINEIKSTQRVIGVISDQHEPASHPDYFNFVCKTFKTFNVTDVVHIGDVVDHHFISRHVSEPDALNPIDELDISIKRLKKWAAKFPDVKWCEGNHDAIPQRQIKTLGMPLRYLKNLNEIYELPKTWEMKDHWEIDNVWYEHGISSTGMYGAKNTAMRYRTNLVVGHAHAHAGVHHLSSPKDNIWGLNVGCGVDEKSINMRYGKKYKDRVCIGCGIVIDGKIPFFVPMG